MCRDALVLKEADVEQMNKGMHMPTFERPEHGKLRVKSEIGELVSRSSLPLSFVV